MDVRVGIVGIVMGSDSDLDTMRAAAEALTDLGIGSEVRVLSAHRTPDETLEWARGAADRGLSVLIAGAGAAAHLPGVVAAVTSLPVIGVPINATALAGVDALLSIAQMPPGVPVATVGIDAARNAGLLAARILGVADLEVRGRYDEFRAAQAAKVRAKDERVRQQFDPERKAPGIGFAAT
jgi:phosphoribosylaminoimidazole carboxylase PurE protein